MPAYEGDSFLTLTLIGQIGLTILSLTMGVILIELARRFSKFDNWVLRVTWAFFLFYLFVWLSPQIYYFYYYLIFESIPFQNVIKYPPSLGAQFSLLMFSNGADLSAHSKGVLIWLMILSVFFRNNSRSVKSELNRSG